MDLLCISPFIRGGPPFGTAPTQAPVGAFLRAEGYAKRCCQFESVATQPHRRGATWGARYALRVSRSVVVSLSLSRRNAASESEPVMYGVYITFQAGRPLGRPLRIAKKHWNFPVLFSLISGFLSSQGASPQVLSAFAGLTAVFGMGTGGSPQLSPLNYVIQASDKSDISDSHSFACHL